MKPERINVRLTPELRRRLIAVCESTGLDEPTALRALVEAFCNRVERDKGIWLPLDVVSAGATQQATANQQIPFRSTVVLPSPANERAPRLNEEPVAPRSTPVSAPTPKLKKTRAVMRGIAKKDAAKK